MTQIEFLKNLRQACRFDLVRCAKTGQKADKGFDLEPVIAQFTQ